MVELMVAMVVSLILVAGVLQIFISTKQSYRVNESLARIQENARFGIDMITDDLRQAGFWGCAPVSQVLDRQTVNFLDFQGATVEADGGIEVTPGTGEEPDAIAMRGAFGRGVPVTNHANAASSISLQTSEDITSTSPVFDASTQAVVISDCNNAEIVTTDATITNAIPATGAFNKAYNTEPAMVYAVGEVSYAVNTNNELTREVKAVDTSGTVTSQANPVIENVENLQIEYGVDTDGDSVPNYYADALAATASSTVVSIRVILTAISDTEIASVPTASSITGTPDNRLRQVYSSTIKLRNRIPNV